MIDTKDTNFIKVITGVRKSGKLTLLSMFKNYLLEKSYTIYIADRTDVIKLC